MVHEVDQFLPRQHGAGAARPWPRQGILPPQWGAGGKRNRQFNQGFGGPRRGEKSSAARAGRMAPLLLPPNRLVENS
jgi:hypothetical protein